MIYIIYVISYDQMLSFIVVVFAAFQAEEEKLMEAKVSYEAWMEKKKEVLSQRAKERSKEEAKKKQKEINEKEDKKKESEVVRKILSPH